MTCSDLLFSPTQCQWNHSRQWSHTIIVRDPSSSLQLATVPHTLGFLIAYRSLQHHPCISTEVLDGMQWSMAVECSTIASAGSTLKISCLYQMRIELCRLSNVVDNKPDSMWLTLSAFYSNLNGTVVACASWHAFVSGAVDTGTDLTSGFPDCGNSS